MICLNFPIKGGSSILLFLHWLQTNASSLPSSEGRGLSKDNTLFLNAVYKQGYSIWGFLLVGTLNSISPSLLDQSLASLLFCFALYSFQGDVLKAHSFQQFSADDPQICYPDLLSSVQICVSTITTVNYLKISSGCCRLLKPIMSKIKFLIFFLNLLLLPHFGLHWQHYYLSRHSDIQPQSQVRLPRHRSSLFFASHDQSVGL